MSSRKKTEAVSPLFEVKQRKTAEGQALTRSETGNVLPETTFSMVLELGVHMAVASYCQSSFSSLHFCVLVQNHLSQTAANTELILGYKFLYLRKIKT